MNMEKNRNDSAETEISYIKSIMLKSEMDYNAFGTYFMILTLYFFISNILIKPTISSLVYKYTSSSMDGRVAAHVASPLSICIWSIITTIPLILLLAFYYKKVKENNRGISMWLFRIQAFLLVFCNGLLPCASVAVSASEEPAGLFSVIAASFILLTTGIFSDSKNLRLFSYFYVVFSIILLTILGIPNLYYDFFTENMKTPPPVYMHLYICFKYIVYEICPIFAYAILSGYMFTKSKGVKKT